MYRHVLMEKNDSGIEITVRPCTLHRSTLIFKKLCAWLQSRRMQSCGQLHKSLILSQPGRSIIPVVSLKRPVASLTARHSLRILAALRRLSPQKSWFLVHSPLFAHVANPLCFLSCLRACAKRLFAPQCVQYTRISSERNRNFWK